MREILPGILTWPWFSPRHGYDFNGWLVRHPEGNVCIDPPEVPDAILEEIVREGVARIVLTNRNHFRASMRVRERTGARISIHLVDAHGKSPGEIALHWPARRILLVGDACVGNPPGECALLPDAVIDDKPALIESLRRLSRLQFDSLLVGDGAPILTE